MSAVVSGGVCATNVVILTLGCTFVAPHEPLLDDVTRQARRSRAHGRVGRQREKQKSGPLLRLGAVSCSAVYCSATELSLACRHDKARMCLDETERRSRCAGDRQPRNWPVPCYCSAYATGHLKRTPSTSSFLELSRVWAPTVGRKTWLCCATLQRMSGLLCRVLLVFPRLPWTSWLWLSLFFAIDRSHMRTIPALTYTYPLMRDKGGQLICTFVSLGNNYAITNESTTRTAKIFFAQGCVVEGAE